MNPMKNTKSTYCLFLLLMAMLPAFGQMPSTYNNSDGSIKDEKAHLDAKTKWIKEHPEEYRKAGGDPESVLNSDKRNETVVPSPPNVALPPFSALKKYVLSSAVAVAAPGMKPNAAELKEETGRIKLNGIGEATQLHLGAGNTVRMFKGKDFDLRAVETRNGNEIIWFSENKSCETCSKRYYLTLESESASGSTYLFKSEDEGAKFSYRLVFQLIP
jgi:hypothetical protein